MARKNTIVVSFGVSAWYEEMWTATAEVEGVFLELRAIDSPSEYDSLMAICHLVAEKYSLAIEIERED